MNDARRQDYDFRNDNRRVSFENDDFLNMGWDKFDKDDKMDGMKDDMKSQSGGMMNGMFDG